MTEKMTANSIIVSNNRPVLNGELRRFVAISSHIMNIADMAIIQSLFCLRNDGKGISNEVTFFAKCPMAPIGQSEHQNRAHIKAPKIMVGHPMAQLNRDPTFAEGLTGPRKSSTRSMKKKGAAALWNITGKSGLLTAPRIAG